MQNLISEESSGTLEICKSSSELFENEFGEYNFEEEEPIEVLSQKTEENSQISVGDSLPYGIRMYYGSTEKIIRMKEIGVKKRILLLGVIGSFTPYCWNRHLFRVLQKSRYYEERYIDYICCVSTNDAFTQIAWSIYLGCDETVLMVSDPSGKFTKKLGMDIVIPWLDDRIRSKRYIIYAEDMIIIKMLVAPDDGPKLKWRCEHLLQEEQSDDDDTTMDSDPWNIK